MWMSKKAKKIKVWIFISAVVLIVVFFLIGMLMSNEPTSVSRKTKPSQAVKASAKSSKLPQLDLQNIIRSNAREFFHKWRKECKERKYNSFVDVMSCIRGIKLRKYLNKKYFDEVMVVRRQIVHMILDRVGRKLCLRKMKDYYIEKELKALYKNMKDNLRRLKPINHHKPNLKVPSPKKCHNKDGKFIWDPP